jgi:hypothetical protein
MVGSFNEYLGLGKSQSSADWKWLSLIQAPIFYGHKYAVNTNRRRASAGIEHACILVELVSAFSSRRAVRSGRIQSVSVFVIFEGVSRNESLPRTNSAVHTI